MTANGSAAEAAAAALPSVNALAAPLIEDLRRDAAALRLGLKHLDHGALVIDAGVDHPGGLEAGRRIAEVCLGGLGRVTLHGAGLDARWPLALSVHSSHPVLGCLASQYAGWSLSLEEGGKTFQALGSGPARALALKEPLFAELGYRDRGEATSLVLEVDRRPPPALAEKIARACGLAPAAVTLILTPTRSLAGTVQVVARVLEVALHKAHALGFPLEQIVDGQGSAPLPPPSPDVVTGMGRTNDAILYGGQVHLFVHGSDADAQRLAWALPSSASRDYGKPFAAVFRDYDGDFFRIDPLLFSPARVVVTALASGNSFLAGRIDRELIDRSFGGGA